MKKKMPINNLTDENLHSYLLELSFVGTKYYGWQRQTQFSNTVQEVLLTILKKISNDPNGVKVLGSSRTDKGVHALSMYCKVTLKRSFPEDKLLISLNQLLPEDILVKSLKKIAPDFKLMSAVKSKTYQYLFIAETFKVLPTAKDWVYPVSKKLDLKILQNACELFVGKHDFVNYRVIGTETKTTVREIYRCYVEEVPAVLEPLPFIPEGTLRFVVEGSGFLKQMVRMMCGVAIAAAMKKIELKDIEESLKRPQEKRLAAPVPAFGLTLVQTKFRD